MAITDLMAIRVMSVGPGSGIYPAPVDNSFKKGVGSLYIRKI